MLHRHCFFHHLGHHFNRTFPVKAFAWPNVQLVGNGIQLFLAVYRQVCALGQVLADQAIDVLVAAALPGAVRVTEVDGHPRLLGDLGMPGHLPALVIGHALAHRQRHPVEGRTEALYGRSRRGIVQLDQHQVAAGAFVQRAHGRGVGLAFDQVTLPMPRHQAVFNLRRTHMNAHHLRDLVAPINASCTWPARTLALAQAPDQLLAQLTHRQGIDRAIDRLATNVNVFKTGNIHAAQLAGNLLGREVFSQQHHHQLKQFAAQHQLLLRATDLSTLTHVALGRRCVIDAVGARVAPQFTTSWRGFGQATGQSLAGPCHASGLPESWRVLLC
ncbi:hypothetical protein WR25_04289 [Diploscapter pachys]|uniref:Uncharacterized protein n=1 Tax=Diploscapter pachys TaxID=2018661 RepID=A0A2A2JXN2_9BILA|nr:hypothetical protein WR25_04289 [Diploscapter pachys]